MEEKALKTQTTSPLTNIFKNGAGACRMGLPCKHSLVLVNVLLPYLHLFSSMVEQPVVSEYISHRSAPSWLQSYPVHWPLRWQLQPCCCTQSPQERQPKSHTYSSKLVADPCRNPTLTFIQDHLFEYSIEALYTSRCYWNNHLTYN